MAFYLSDDGTLDTVVVCEACGDEVRYTYQPDGDEDEVDGYLDFVEWCLKDADEDHQCAQSGERSRCEGCGMPIPLLREDADPDEFWCDTCLRTVVDEMR